MSDAGACEARGQAYIRNAEGNTPGVAGQTLALLATQVLAYGAGEGIANLD